MQTVFETEICREDKKRQSCNCNRRQILQTDAETFSRSVKYNLEISRETKISISTAYNKLQYLNDLNLLKGSGQINQDRKKFFFYQSKIRIISIFLR